MTPIIKVHFTGTIIYEICQGIDNLRTLRTPLHGLRGKPSLFFSETVEWRRRCGGQLSRIVIQHRGGLEGVGDVKPGRHDSIIPRLSAFNAQKSSDDHTQCAMATISKWSVKWLDQPIIKMSLNY